jgi:hypothetical protein|tara:strand:+ start:170 stop:340 length:171 start_codon:yes stop_codon:yes gene_type:complete
MSTDPPSVTNNRLVFVPKSKTATGATSGTSVSLELLDHPRTNRVITHRQMVREVRM